jgi:SAM-dependent methyltransferase
VNNQYTDYDQFAWLYNKYWSDRLIGQIFKTHQDYLLNRLNPGSHILDVACGNGHLAARLIDLGYRVTGIDGSEAMLGFARINAPEGEFIAVDARAFSLSHIVDAAMSTCDSLNHVMETDGLKQVFANVFKVLRPEGRFLFDLNTEKGYLEHWGGRPSGCSAEDHAFVLQLSYDEQVQQAGFDVTMFRLEDRDWKRFRVQLRQQYYPPELVQSLLADVGFGEVETYDVCDDLKLEGVNRTMYVAQRPK